MGNSSIQEKGRLDTLKVTRFKAWRELTLFAAIVMELSWAVLWYRAFIYSEEPLSYARVFVVFGVIMIFSYFITRLMNGFDLRLITRRLIFMGVILISQLFGLKTLIYTRETMGPGELLSREITNFQDMTGLIPAEFMLMLIILFVCWRGMKLVGRHIAPENVISGFRTGIFLFVGYGIFFTYVDSAPIYTLYIFLFFSLFAMSISRISILGVLRGGHNIPFSQQWLLGIILILLIIIGVSALGVNLLKDQGFNFIFDIFFWIINFIVLLITPVVWLITWLIGLVWEWLNIEMMFQLFVDMMHRLQSIIEEVLGTMNKWFERMENSDLRHFFLSLGPLRPYILWGTIILFMVLLLFALKRHYLNDQEEDEQEYQSLIDQEDMFDLLRSAFRRGLDKLVEGLDQIARLRSARQLLGAARIRRIYAQLMDMTDKLDHPRPPSLTPLEFMPTLKDIFPNMSEELVMITNAYLRVRYGELPETKGEVEIVEQAWKRVKTLGQEKLRTKKRSFELKR